MGETSVSGSEAARWKAVRLDSLADAVEGELVSADCVVGNVKWKDKITGEAKEKNFGPHAIRLVPKR